MGVEIKNGIKAFYAIGIYFLLIEIVGLTHTTFLRMLNIFIAGYYVNKSISERMKKGSNFISLAGSAFSTNLIAVILSTFALSAYIFFFQGVEHISTLSQPLLALGYFKLSLSQFSFAIFAEGFASGIILTFSIMQYWKNKLEISNI